MSRHPSARRLLTLERLPHSLLLPKPEISLPEKTHAFLDSPRLQEIRHPIGELAEKRKFVLNVAIGGDAAEEMICAHDGFFGGGETRIVPGHLRGDLRGAFFAELFEEMRFSDEAGHECCGAFL